MIELMTASSNVAPFEEIISTVNQCVCALNAIEAGKQSAPPCNTGSPKLPPCEKCGHVFGQSFYKKTKGYVFCPYCGRQLRAGA